MLPAAHLPVTIFRSRFPVLLLLLLLLLALAGWPGFMAHGQTSARPATDTAAPALGTGHAARSQQFLRGRQQPAGVPGLAAARRQQAAMLAGQQAPALSPRNGLRSLDTTTSLSAAWQPVGPAGIASLRYGTVTGRVTSIAVDPADASGNTVYLGTTGGGVWKSVNAAGPAAAVSFQPLTDTLPVFSANAGTYSTPSLSIGAVSVANGVVLAGTGDPNDATDSYYGAGLLRSADGGVTWTLIGESQDGVAGTHSWMGLGFAGFAWSTAAPNLVVAAVSDAYEGSLVNAATDSSRGLFYSTDAGLTWHMGSIYDGAQFVQVPEPVGANRAGNAATAVVWNPLRQRFYAAVRFHGYYESADGVTWTRLAHQPGAGLTAAACPSVPGGSGSPGCPIFRGALAVQPATGDLFALSSDVGNRDTGLWQDVCGVSGTSCASPAVQFGHQINSAPLETGSGSTAILQADYDLSLLAMPSPGANGSSDTTLYVGTVDLYRCSLAAGCTLRNTTNAVNGCNAPAMVAPSQHAIAATAGTAGALLYLGNDGGVWRSSDGVAETGPACAATDASHFDNLNGGLGSLAETISVAASPSDAAVVLGGFGALGTAASTSQSGSNAAWAQLSSGEGGYTAINPADPSRWFISTGAGVAVRACSNGTACAASDFAGTPTIGPVQVGGDLALLDAPFLLDPADPSQMIVGTCRVWRGPAEDGALWSGSNALGGPLAASAASGCSSTSAFVRSLAAVRPAGANSSAGSPVIYAGMAGGRDGGGTAAGHLYATTTGGVGAGAWRDLALSPVTNALGNGSMFNPGGFDVSSVAADPHDASGKTIYATIMGFAGGGINAAHVYRSIDGGASWVNISRNLPNVPANSVIVDPNDANTVYVAMDTGVYVTTAVSTCPSANCWSVLGAGLPNAPVTQLLAGANVPTGDGRVGELRAATYGRGIWQLPLLTAAFPAQPAISLSPNTLAFGTQSAGTASPAQTVTVTNTGNSNLTVSRLAITGDFAETGTCSGSTVAVGASCSVAVTFLPVASGARAGLLTIYGNVPGGQATVALTGTGAPPAAVVLTPLFLSFPATTLNGISAAQNVTISNTGGVPAAIGIPVVTGDFAMTANTCGASLPAQTGCTVAIGFRPTASGSRSGTLTVPTGAGTVTASLSGTGTSPATDAVAPGSLSFGPQMLLTASAAQPVTLTNTGDVALTLIAAAVTEGDFSADNGCGTSLNPHSSCSIAVVFQPKNVGGETGVLTVSDQYRTQTVALHGTGIAPAGVSLAPTGGLQFAATAVGSTAAVQTVTLTNNGGVPLAITSITMQGDFGMAAQASTCGTTLPAGSACTMGVAFAPAAAGPRTGTLVVTSSAANSPHRLTMSGEGVDFQMAPNGSTSQTVASGKTAAYPLVVSSVAGVPGAVAIACTGLPANAACSISPASVTLGAPTQVLVSVATGVTLSAAEREPATSAQRSGMWLAGLLPVGLLLLRRRSTPVRALLCVVVSLGLFGAGGCGAGRAIPTDLAGSGGGGTAGGAVTPTGTYAITVTATSAGLTRSVPLTLIVQ